MFSHPIAIENNPTKGILICLFAYFFVSLLGICQKFIAPHVSLPMILFFQNGVCLLLISPRVLRAGAQSLKTNYVGSYCIRIASGLGCYATLFYLIRFTPLSEAFLYQYSASLWIPFITMIWSQTYMPKNRWFGILSGFVGIAIILKPSADMINVIAFIGILCGILQGIYVVAIRRLSVIEPTTRILFYNFLVGTIFSGLMLIYYWTPIELIDCVWLIGVGATTFLAQKLITISLKHADATTLAPVCYTTILFSGVFSWFIWQEIPQRSTLLGMLLIVFGCLSSVLASRIKPLVPQPNRMPMPIENYNLPANQ